MIGFLYITPNDNFDCLELNGPAAHAVFDAIKEPMSKQLGAEWFKRAEFEFEVLEEINLTELSADDFNLVCSLILNAAKDNTWIAAFEPELQKQLKIDPRYKN
ncbi:hypothetical protein [Vitreoscilla stercoraria]|uniref:Uncharacterized protein n=1 Tax=Vitreoscilla stercoraria TaxID=61 RepID=A0ABY4EFU3_VITST|nr:hypothetical protein [Vitreoscilla stercoraria]UOO93588.1 hypothetical protein LVJ81_06070 [Vitreoscilla stercoraria]